MNERRKCFNSPPEECGRSEILKLAQSKSKINRLKRSPRPTQQPRPLDSSNICQTDFKTPTRPTRSRFDKSLIAVDSPNTDSEFQQDIIWDADTPVRNGKGRSRRSANIRVVDISDIVSRIAPKNGRPVVSESSLLQWIGDSAIPCTPEVQQPRTRIKSTRQNTVDDLLKLAKQFDFHMIRQDEAHGRETRNPRLEEDTDDEMELNNDENQPPLPPNELAPKNAPQAFKPTNTSEEDPVGQVALDQEMEDDLDFLFDGPTQQISGRLSQTSSNRSQDVPVTAPISSSSHRVPVAKGCDSLPGRTSAAAATHASAGNNEFDDDWDKDDLLDDSLVFEMTQNPDMFAVPRHSSTQKALSWRGKDSISNNICSSAATSRHHQQSNSNVHFSATQGQNAKPKSRQTFQLEANTAYQVEGLPSNRHVSGSSKSVQHSQSSVFPSSKAAFVESGHTNNPRRQSQSYQSVKVEPRPPQASLLRQSSATSASSSSTWRSPTETKRSPIPTSPCPTRPLQTKTSSDLHLHSAERKSAEGQGPNPAQGGFSGVPDEDLDSLFASDSIWDDGEDDDDLFCEACDNMEALADNAAALTAKHPPRTSPAQRTSLPAVTSQYSTTEGNGPKEATGFALPRPPNVLTQRRAAPAGAPAPAFTKHMQAPSSAGPVSTPSGSNALRCNALSGSATSNHALKPSNPPGKGQYKFAPVKSTSALGSATCGAVPSQLVGKRGGTTSFQSSAKISDGYSHHVSKPTPVSSKVLVSNPAAAVCSDAEIERKKQQAVERRQLRMQAGQNLRAPV